MMRIPPIRSCMKILSNVTDGYVATIISSNKWGNIRIDLFCIYRACPICVGSCQRTCRTAKKLSRILLFFFQLSLFHSNFIYDDSIVVIHKQRSCTGRPVIMSINWKVNSTFSYTWSRVNYVTCHVLSVILIRSLYYHHEEVSTNHCGEVHNILKYFLVRLQITHLWRAISLHGTLSTIHMVNSPAPFCCLRILAVP